MMTSFQWVIFFVFFASYTIRTAITCFALDLIIDTFGPDKLGNAYSLAAVITVAACAILGLTSHRISVLMRFLTLHIIIALVALLCLVFRDPSIQAQLAFFCIIGFGLLIYFSNWSIALAYISPFESKRLFPLMSLAAQVGVFCGSSFAMASNLGFPKEWYFPAWFLVELVVLGLGLTLTRTEETKENSAFFFLDDEDEEAEKKRDLEENQSIIHLFRSYRFLPQITVWIFLWGFIYTAMLSRVGSDFKESGANLTALYGVLALTASALGSLVSTFVFPALVKIFRLGAILLVCSMFVSSLGVSYLSMPAFSMAVMAYLGIEFSAHSFKALAVNTEIGLYPERYRDQLRLFGEIFPQSLGAAVVGIVFLGPSMVIVPAIIIAFALLVIVAVNARETFNTEIINLLHSEDEEERRNATALYDRLERQDEYENFLFELTESNDLATQINILKTFASLETAKPLPEILDLLDTDTDASLRIAILRYMDALNFKRLDPFLYHETIGMLKEICTNSHSNVARAMAIKTFVQNAQPNESVAFVMKELASHDDRIIANAIDGLRHLKYPGVVNILEPYLKHETARVRANTVVALWHYPKARFRVKAALTEMLYSQDIGQRISAIYAVGQIQELSFLSFLREQVPNENINIRRISLISLLQLGVEEFIDPVVELILGDNEGQAINTCYLTMSLNAHLLNEGIIAHIFYRGGDARRVAHSRYSRCGAFCREQLDLLAGQVHAAHGPLTSSSD